MCVCVCVCVCNYIYIYIYDMRSYQMIVPCFRYRSVRESRATKHSVDGNEKLFRYTLCVWMTAVCRGNYYMVKCGKEREVH